MQVILLEKVVNLGNLGEVVRVRDGYARNFLIPQRKARRATDAALKEFEARRAELEKVQAEKLAAAAALGARVFVDGQHLAEAIDVAADQMAAEAVGRAHGALQIDDRALAQLAQRGQAQGLGGGIGLEAAGVECDDDSRH
ncbi:hypothetical protein G6F65_021904 [Rhizopus arrhizus]|nr:hypothetical protein G6F65_021904 [Rhizopus arrhizus]